MPRGVRREKTIRLTEELEQISESLNKTMRMMKTLQSKKKEIEKQLEECEKESAVKLINECGLNSEEIKEAIEAFRNKNSISA